MTEKDRLRVHVCPEDLERSSVVQVVLNRRVLAVIEPEWIFPLCYCQ